MLKKTLLFFLSLALVAFGQPAYVNFFSLISACIGYALFWFSLREVTERKKRFALSCLWFSAVQAIWLSWMTSLAYTGPLMLIVYVFFIFLLGIEFAFLTLLVPTKKPFPLKKLFFIACIMPLLEGAHLFILSGYTWNPIGLSLSGNLLSLQFVSLLGVGGLTLWVMITNLFAYRFFITPAKKTAGTFVLVAAVPFMYGLVSIGYFQTVEPTVKATLSALLVQPNLYPENKIPTMPYLDRFLPPLRQWQKIFSMVKEQNQSSLDLIILPESAVSFSASVNVYPLHLAKKIWEEVFFEENTSFPNVPLQLPYAQKREGLWYVSNLFFAQSLSNYYHADLIIGLDDELETRDKYQNFAYFLQPNVSEPKRYAKRTLVPVTEYFPFTFCSSLAKKYGIEDAFVPGKEMKIFPSIVPISVSICYEETFGHQISKAKHLGTSLFVNISNDVWFPHSTLPYQQYSLGKLRAVENGIPLLRACNTGLTVGVDAFGREILKAPLEKAEALFLNLPLEKHFTFYSYCGDWMIFSICGGGIVLFLATFVSSRKK